MQAIPLQYCLIAKPDAGATPYRSPRAVNCAGSAACTFFVLVRSLQRSPSVRQPSFVWLAAALLTGACTSVSMRL